MRLTGPYISQGERPCSITYTVIQRRLSTRQSSSARKLGSSPFFGQGKFNRARIKGGSFAELVMRLRAASKDERLLVCYEAGDDGFWLARTLAAEGVDCRVLDPASLQVNRRARRVKTDRIDVLMLVRALIAIDRGDRHVCAIVNVPSIEEEDARRSHRERQRLIRERTAHTTGSRAFSSRKAFAASRRVDANVSISRSCAPAKGIRWQIGFGPNSNANMPGLIS